MNETIIFGASDDMIGVEGNVQEGLYANDGAPTHVRVGDWVFRAEYNRDGEWKFDVVDHPNGGSWTHLSVGESDEHKDYTEVIRFDCPSEATAEKVQPPD